MKPAVLLKASARRLGERWVYEVSARYSSCYTRNNKSSLLSLSAFLLTNCFNKQVSSQVKLIQNNVRARFFVWIHVGNFKMREEDIKINRNELA